MNKELLSFPLSLLYEVAPFCLGCAVLRKHTEVKVRFSAKLCIAPSLQLWLARLLAGVAEKSVERIAWRHSLESCDCNQWEESNRQAANSASSSWKRN